MKILITFICLVTAAAQMTFADIPDSFDPRSQTQNIVEGCGFIIQPMPLTADYLIITRPNKDNPDNVFFTFRATADASLKPRDFAGKFVFIKATRLKSGKKGEPSLRITSITEITHW